MAEKKKVAPKRGKILCVGGPRHGSWIRDVGQMWHEHPEVISMLMGTITKVHLYGRSILAAAEGESSTVMQYRGVK